MRRRVTVGAAALPALAEVMVIDLEPEAPAPVRGPPPWRRRGTWWAVLAVGAVLLGIGVSGVVAARRSDDDARSTTAEVVVLREEIADLERLRDAAEAEAAAVAFRAVDLGASVERVQGASRVVEAASAHLADAYRLLDGCRQVDVARLVACGRAAIGEVGTDMDGLTAAIAELRSAAAALEEDLR